MPTLPAARPTSMPCSNHMMRNSTEFATECSKPANANTKTDMIIARLFVRSSLMRPL